MSKNSRNAPVQMDDFEPFYLKNNMLWVPYSSDGGRHMHTLTPEVAWRGIGFAVKTLMSTGKVVPFTLAALRDRMG